MGGDILFKCKETSLEIRGEETAVALIFRVIYEADATLHFRKPGECRQ